MLRVARWSFMLGVAAEVAAVPVWMLAGWMFGLVAIVYGAALFSLCLLNTRRYRDIRLQERMLARRTWGTVR